MCRIAFVFVVALAYNKVAAPAAVAESRRRPAAPAEFVQVQETKHMKTAEEVEQMEKEIQALKQEPQSAANSKNVQILGTTLPIKFFKTPDNVSWVTFLDNDQWTFKVPAYTMYVYPLCFWVFLWVAWMVLCIGVDRTGLSFRPVIESACCMYCLWASLATHHNIISKTRAWSYGIALMFLYTLWTGLDIYFEAQGRDAPVPPTGESWELVMYYIFAPIMLLVWIAFSVERMWVRMYYRRLKDPTAVDSRVVDFLMSCMCSPFAAMQEAEVVAELTPQLPAEEGKETHW